MGASRVRRTLVTALVVMAVGGGAGAYVYTEHAKTPDLDRQKRDDARLFMLGRNYVTSVKLTSKRVTFTATQDSKSGWTLRTPIVGPADPNAMSALVDNMAGLPLTVEVARGDEAKAQLAKYGLDHPLITVTASTTDGKSHTLYVGEISDIDHLRIVAGGDPLRIGRVEDTFFWALNRDLFAFRAKQVFQLDRSTITEITVERLGDAPRTMTLTRDKEMWTVEAEGRKLPADPFVMDRFLLLLTRDLKADAFVTDSYQIVQASLFGLDRPRFSVTIKSGEGRVDRAFIGEGRRPDGTGDPSENGKAAPFVHLEGASTVAVVYNALLSDLDKSLPEFRDRRVSDYDLEAVRRIEIMRPGKPDFVLDGVANTWRLLSPESGTAREDRAQAIAMRYSKLRAVRVVGEDKSPETLKTMGLDPAEQRVVIRAEGGRILADLRFGKPVDADTVYVTAEGIDRVSAVKDAELRLLPLTVDDIIRRGAPNR